MSETPSQIDVHALVAAVRSAPQPESDSIVSGKNGNVLVMGILAAVGALIWQTTLKAPESFGLLQQQTAEIRTTVLEMKTTLGDIQTRLDNNTRATSEQQAKITGLESTVKSNSDRLQRIEEELRAKPR